MGIGPYDAIHVGAAAATIPSAVVEQLAKPGRMFIPVGTFMQFIEQVDKDAEGNLTSRKVMGVRVRSSIFKRVVKFDTQFLFLNFYRIVFSID
jgi:protein-L-isoaspartate O-methyltransferase